MRRRGGLAGLLSVTGAALAVAIAAGCGGGGNGGGKPAPSTVTVVHGGASVAGEKLAIVLNDSAGRFVSSTAVTGSGADVVTVPHDGSVIFAAAVNATTLGWSEVVQPPNGTTIHVPDPLLFVAPTPTPAGVQTWNVSWNPVASATTYRVLGACGGTAVSGTSTTITNAGCTERPTAKILVTARDAGARLLAWHLTDVIPALPNVTTAVNVLLDQHARVTVSASMTGVDETVVASGGAQIALLDDDLSSPSIFSANSGPQTGSNFGLFGDAPPLGPVLAQQYLAFTGAQGIIRTLHAPQVPASLAMDVGGIELATFPAYDAPSGAFFFSTPLTFGDGMSFFSELSDGTSLVVFQAVAPPGTQVVALPALPADFLPPRPLGGFQAGAALTVADVTAMNGYADFVDGFPLTFPYFYGDDGLFLVSGLN